MKTFLTSIDAGIEPLRKISDSFASPLLDLGIRLYMAKIFFTAGHIKLEKLMNEGWEEFVVPFQEYYPIPGIPADIAAPMAMAGELGLSVLLALGLFGRFAAAGLLIMTMAIQYLVPAEYGIQNVQHYFWMFLFSVILFKGAGAFSLDALLVKWLRK